MHDSHILVFIHIFGGCLGIITGALALALRKGSRWHRKIGDVFAAAMMTMSSVAAYMAFVGTEIKPPALGNFFGGILTFYLVGTAWLAGRRKDRERSVIDAVALLIPLAVGLAQIHYGLKAAGTPDGTLDEVPAGMYFFMSFVALGAAGGDIRQLVWGVAGIHRVARHLWRMCFALWIAASSFFIGQPQVFPEWLHRTGLLFVPSLLIIVLMFFWLIRVLFTNAYKRKVISARPATDLPGA